MIKEFCDICGEEITDYRNASTYKVKREISNWYDRWWERLCVHDSCWVYMCQYIRDQRRKRGNYERKAD